MSDKLKLGHIITSDQHRDAIHVAVVPIEAETILYPGNHVGVLDGKAGKSHKHIGVVDPFLKDIVQEGERFWLFLYPGSITSLRHEWLHPAFDKDALKDTEKEESEQWLRKFCIDNPTDSGNPIDYDFMIEHLKDDIEIEHGFNAPEITDEFKKHFNIVTGSEVKGYFSCCV